jgi:hypothetical protein
MATTTCPTCGAQSKTSDYCDTCGAALAPDPAGTGVAAAATDAPSAATPASTSVKTCPNCGAVRNPDDAYCEVCGLDFATGKMPAAPAPTPAPQTSAPPSGWTAVIEADRAFFDGNEAETPGAASFPEGVGARRVALAGNEVVIGRRSEGKGFFPDIDLSSPVADPGVSHRHAVLRRAADGGWTVVDEGSTNGTWVNDDARPLDHGVATALHDGDHINLGSFTRITVVHDGEAKP